GQPKYPNQMHYGIMELPHGRGRIILCQLIPEYDWFENHKGRDSSLGKLLLENLLHYAVQQVAVRQSYADPPSVPEAYAPALSAILDVVRRPDADEMRLDQWDVETDGLFEVRWDDRDLITVHHPDQPSQQGGYALLSRTFDIEHTPDERVLLSFYCTDDYLGGPEPQYEGDRSIGQVQNMKEGYRFVEVSVDDVLIWERDVLGPNPYEWPYLFQVIDISEHVKDKDRVRVCIRVVDRRESAETFWTDVFVSRIKLFQGIAGREGPGGISAPYTGEFTPVISVHDAPSERSTLVVYGDGRAAPLMSVDLSADDQSAHWVIGESVSLNEGDELLVELRREPISQLDEDVQRVYLVPTAYMAHAHPTVLPDVRNWFAAPETPERIGMEVKGPLGADISAPVTHGVPFAQGHLLPSQLGRIRLLDDEERPVPVQTRSLALWPDGSVKWTLLSFKGRPGAYNLVLSDTVAETAGEPLAWQIDGRSFVVNTQRLKMTLDLSAGFRISRMLVDGQDVGPSAIDLSITYTNGQRLSLEDSVLSEVRLIEEGPERAVLWIRGNFLRGGQADLEFTWQWYFFRDQPAAFVDVAFTNRLGVNVDISDIRLHVHGNYGRLLGLPADAGFAAGTKEVAVTTENLQYYDLSASSTTLSVVQSDERTYKVYQDDEQILEGIRFPGWLTLTDGRLSFVTAVRHFWQQAPKSAVVTDGSVEFGLWASEAGQTLPVADGFQKTHRLLLGWTDGDEAPVWKALLTQPYVLATDPHYLLGTQALGVLSVPQADLPGLFPLGGSYEQSVASTYDNYLKKREDRREYGMQSFGDDTFEWGYGPVYTFWSNQEYDHHYGFLLQYLRGQDERFWQIGDQAALHYRDVDVIHHSTNPLHMGAPRAHNSKHVVDEGWYPDHNLGGVSVTHAWVEGLWLHYLLTGDELTHEAARGASDWFVAEVDRGRWGAGGPERGPGWSLIALAGAYRATSDERYLRAAEKVAEEIYSHQDPVRGVYSVPVSEQRSYEGGTSFMTGIMGRGLARLYLETGCPRAALAVARLYDWLTREAKYPDHRFLYKQAPNWRQPTGDSQVVSLLGYGLAFRDRREDWPMVLGAANLRASVRSLSWMPETLALFERLYGTYHPLRLIQPDPRAALIGRQRGPGETSLALVRLQATEMIEGVLVAEEVPTGMTVSPRRLEYRLERGQQYKVFDMTIEAAPTVAPGSYELIVRDPAREDLSFTLPVSVMSWQMIDEFRAPTTSSWFGIELYSRPTEEESSGWEHVKINNIDRLQRVGTEEEYLLYDAPGLYDLALTMYAPYDQKNAAEELLEISVVDGESSEKQAIEIVWEDTDSDLAKVTVTLRDKYARGNVKLKVTVLSGGSPGTPQLERLAIKGWQ
ncbi:MAG: beta-L-arabinofuranosidase domain-containing protein, partial [Limnochordia bacterium]